MLNNAYLQQKIVCNYLNNNLFSNTHTDIIIDHFDYDLLDQKIYSDFHIVYAKENDIDTLLSLSNISIKINLLNALFFNNVKIDHIDVTSTQIHTIDSNQDNQTSIEIILATLSSLNQDIYLANLELDNLIIKENQDVLYNINLSLDQLRMSKDYLDIANIKLIMDSSFVNATCQIVDNTINIDITESYLNNISSFLEEYHVPLYLDHGKLAFESTISINKDSTHCIASLKYGNSILDLDFLHNTDTFCVNYQSNFHLIDFSFIPLRYHIIDSVKVAGYLKSNTIDAISYQGLIDSKYGSLDLHGHKFKDEDATLLIDLIDLDIGFLLNHKLFGKINANLSCNSRNNKLLNFNSNISNLVFNGYTYQNILIQEHTTSEKKVGYSVEINDPNLHLLADYNLNSLENRDNIIYPFSLSGMIQDIDLHALNYPISDSIISISTEFIIDNINLVNAVDQFPFLELNNPIIKFKNFSYNKNGLTKYIDFFDLSFEQNMNHFYINSDIGFAECKMFGNTISDIINLNIESPFQLSLDLNQASILSDLFSKNIKFNDQLLFHVDYNNHDTPFFSLQTPDLTVFNTDFFDINFENQKDSVSLINLKIAKILFSDKFPIDNFRFSTLMEDERSSNFKLSYMSNNLYPALLTGDLIFHEDYVDLEFAKESFIHLSNQYWQVDSTSNIKLNRDKIEFKDVSFQTEGQTLNVSGWLNKDPHIAFSFNNFNIDSFNPFFKNDQFSFNGILDGDVFFNASSFPIISGNFEVDNLICNNMLLGKLTLKNYSNTSNDSIYTRGFIENKINLMNFVLKYPLDGTKKIHADIHFNEFPLEVIDTLLDPIQNLNGDIYGDIELRGPINDYEIVGKTEVKRVNFEIPYLGIDYSGKNNSLFINFENDRIVMNNFNFYDNIYNTSAMFNGEIMHSGLRNMSYDLVIQSDSLYALKTEEYDNSHYYGDIFLRGDMFIQGQPNKIKLDIDAHSKEGSVVMIPLSGSKEIEENKFIQFINDDSAQLNPLSNNIKPAFNMDFNLSIDNQSEIQLIFDEELGNLIKGYGEGDLLLKIDKEGDFEIFGDFEIEKGDYLFTLQDVITKSFEIERGGIISFNGGIENAKLNLNVLYNVQASLHPLNSTYDRNTKSPVVCRMAISGPLLNPDIDFTIDILNSDQMAEASLESIINTDQKLLEQFLYLLIANSFLVENDPTIDYLGNTIATTGTELLSNQLSNWLSQTTDAFDLGFKWIPGTSDSLSYQQVELAVSKKFLDNRVVINGNVGTPPEQSEANIIGDLDIEYDFFKDGRFKLRVFNRTEDYDPLSESLGYEQGVGIFFKKQFNNLQELFIIDKSE